MYLAPGAEAISEFARQHSGRWLTGTCVEASALMCAIALDPGHFQVASGDVGDELAQMVNDWRASDPNVSANGASNFVDAANWLRQQGLSAIDDLGVAGDWYGELQRGIPAGHVYLVGVTNAQALPGDEPGVHNHGLCAYGVDDAGNIVCGDPDNWRANVNMPGNPVGQSVTYSRQDFISGQISSLTKVWGQIVGIPAGWTDDGATLKAPNGNVVVHGFRDWVLGHSWRADDYPLEAEQAITSGSIEYGNALPGPGARQEFRFTTLGWTAAWGVYVIATGQDVLALVKQQAALAQQVAALQAQLAAAQKPVDPALVAEAAAFKAIKAALTVA